LAVLPSGSVLSTNGCFSVVIGGRFEHFLLKTPKWFSVKRAVLGIF
jgi:hypothetical protein